MSAEEIKKVVARNKLLQEEAKARQSAKLIHSQAAIRKSQKALDSISKDIERQTAGIVKIFGSAVGQEEETPIVLVAFKSEHGFISDSLVFSESSDGSWSSSSHGDMFDESSRTAKSTHFGFIDGVPCLVERKHTQYSNRGFSVRGGGSSTSHKFLSDFGLDINEAKRAFIAAILEHATKELGRKK